MYIKIKHNFVSDVYCPWQIRSVLLTPSGFRLAPQTFYFFSLFALLKFDQSKILYFKNWNPSSLCETLLPLLQVFGFPVSRLFYDFWCIVLDTLMNVYWSLVNFWYIIWSFMYLWMDGMEIILRRNFLVMVSKCY